MACETCQPDEYHIWALGSESDGPSKRNRRTLMSAPRDRDRYDDILLDSPSQRKTRETQINVPN